ncbi:MAG TPA: LysM domain-containing protein [Anaerolineae bacterium]
MASGRIRIGALIGLVLSILLATGCTRDAAQDPLANATTGAQSAQGTATALTSAAPTPTSVIVVAQVTPATSTQLPTSTNTPPPTAIPAQTPVPPTATPPPTAPPGTTTYTVKAGDRLFSIGRQFGVNPYSIAQANNILPPYIIHPGDVLKIPTGGTTITPAPGGKTHVVQPGENLFRIALRYGSTVQALAAANGITNINLIFVGQVLKIP